MLYLSQLIKQKYEFITYVGKGENVGLSKREDDNTGDLDNGEETLHLPWP